MPPSQQNQEVGVLICDAVTKHVTVKVNRVLFKKNKMEIFYAHHLSLTSQYAFADARV